MSSRCKKKHAGTTGFHFAPVVLPQFASGKNKPEKIFSFRARKGLRRLLFPALSSHGSAAIRTGFRKNIALQAPIFRKAWSGVLQAAQKILCKNTAGRHCLRHLSRLFRQRVAQIALHLRTSLEAQRLDAGRPHAPSLQNAQSFAESLPFRGFNAVLLREHRLPDDK